MMFGLVWMMNTSAQIPLKLKYFQGGKPISGARVHVFDSLGYLPKDSGFSDAKGIVFRVNGDRLIVNSSSYLHILINKDTCKGWVHKMLLSEKEGMYVSCQEASLEDLEQVVFSAGRFQQKLTEVTVSMEIVKPRQLERTNVVKLDGILEQVPGVSIINGQANIRGGSGFAYGAGSRVLLLVDEIPMLSADASDIKWDFIPLENIQQIEILKGASSALYGSGALGGVISIRTQKPGLKPQTKFQISSGVFNRPPFPQWQFEKGIRPQFSLSFLHSRRWRGWEIVVGGYTLQDKGYRFSETYDNRRINLSLGKSFKQWDFKISATGFSLKGGNFLFWTNLDSAYYPNQTTISYMDNRRMALDPYIRFRSKNQNHQYIFKGRYFLTDNVNTTGQSSKGEMFFQEFQWQVNQKYRRFQWTQTSGYVHTLFSTRSPLIYGYHLGRNHAVFTQTDVKWKKLNINIGLRQEWNRVDMQNWQGQPVFRTGLSHAITQSTFLRTSWGTAYRFPSVAERFTFTRSGSIAIFPNPNIQSETGYSTELGVRQLLKWKTVMAYFDMAFFQTNYKNMVDFIFGYYPPVPGGLFNADYLGFQTQNVQNARISGVEISQGGEIKSRRRGHGWWVIGYTFIQPINADSTAQNLTKNDPDRFLRYRFRHQWKVNADWTFKKMAIGFTWRFQSHMLNIDSILEKPVPFTSTKIIPGVEEYRIAHDRGFGLLDFRISYELSKKFNLSFVIKNVFNTDYMFFPGNMGAPRLFVIQCNGKW